MSGEVTPRTDASRWLSRACRLFLSGRGSIVFDLDPGEVLTLAPAHQLEPMLHALAGAGRIEGELPGAVTESWLAAYLVTLLRNKRRLKHLQGVLDGCRRSGLEVLVLKGPVHGVRVWGDIGLRPMIDLDLLCRERELSAVTVVLRNNGFLPEGKTSPFHLEFRHSETGNRIELHFDVYEVFDQRTAFRRIISDRTQTVECGGVQIPALSPECCLVFDLGHLLHNDLRISMRALVDFAGQLRRTPPERNRVQELLQLTDLAGEYAQLVSLTDALGWTSEDAGDADLELMKQLEEYWRGLPEDAGPGAMRELLYHPGLTRKISKGFGALFPPAAYLREQSATGSIAALRARHAYSLLSGIVADLTGGPGLNRLPAISLKRDVYRRRTGRKN